MFCGFFIGFVFFGYWEKVDLVLVLGVSSVYIEDIKIENSEKWVFYFNCVILIFRKLELFLKVCCIFVKNRSIVFIFCGK